MMQITDSSLSLRCCRFFFFFILWRPHNIFVFDPHKSQEIQSQVRLDSSVGQMQPASRQLMIMDMQYI